MAFGIVYREHLDKAVDFCFSEASVLYRQMQINGVSEESKKDEVDARKGKRYGEERAGEEWGCGLISLLNRYLVTLRI